MMMVATTTRTAQKGYGIGKYRLCQALDLLREAGFTVVDWYVPIGELFEDPDKALDWSACERWAHSINEHAQKLGMRFNQMHGLDYDRALGDEHISAVERMTDNALRAATILGIRDVVMHPIIMEPGRRDFKSCISENVRFLREKAAIAGRLGLRLAVENMIAKRCFDGRSEWRFCTCWAELRALVEAVDCENVGYCFDVGHANYSGMDVYETLVAMGERLFAIHVHDNDTFSDQHLLPYQGTVDFETFTRGLAHAGYKGDMTMESSNVAKGMPPEMTRLMLKAVYEGACHLARRVDYHTMQKEGAINGV
jgi:sugar phosphate isomerase/epimerase